ncbi:hypothetical protein BP6252_11539 [Coleophoma cylindrospora]|uniref:Rhodopsin domain-containing protein n=1 Tax=Coleophoma cylindrospora TaxID=1849047 RepID=A0A3D8QJV4_9HELO|nr:hypothetical protein BP6252_11539 [Coleophoma cylindrospora]
MSTEEYNGDQLVIVCVLFLILTWTTVALRCFVRMGLTDTFQIDDWLMVTAQIVFTISCSFILRGVHYGIGRHNAAVDQPDEIQALMYQALATLTYVANMMFIKLSICVLLLRIAIRPLYIWILRISMVVVGLWSLAIFLYDIFQCTPVQAQWDYTIHTYKCVGPNSIVSAAYAISVMTILSDWLYALLPIPMIWNINMTAQAKFTVGIILSLGIFASIATLIRMRFLIDLTNVDDILYAGTNPMIWTLVEPGVAIVAASLITIRPLLRKLNFRGFVTTNQTPAGRREGPYGHSISLRDNVVHGSGSWNTTTSTSGENLRRFSVNRLTHEEAGKQVSTITSETLMSDGNSDEYILGENRIQKTVDVTVVHSSKERS